MMSFMAIPANGVQYHLGLEHLNFVDKAIKHFKTCLYFKLRLFNEFSVHAPNLPEATVAFRSASSRMTSFMAISGNGVLYHLSLQHLIFVVLKLGQAIDSSDM